MTTTLIRKADVAIVWDAALGRHEYLAEADLAFADGRGFAPDNDRRWGA